MRILILILLTSCSILSKNDLKNNKTVVEKIANCTEKYLSKYGIKPDKAFEICEKIYKNVDRIK